MIVAPNPRGSTGFGQKFVDDISQDWNGKVMTDLTAVFDEVVKLPYVDASRQGIAGASYGGYAVDWLIGHTNRFKAAVTHDGVFNMESMSLATEELWFTEWETDGPATSAAARASFAKMSPHRFAENIKTPTLVITERARLPRARRSGSAALHGPAPQRRAVRDARVSRRGPLGAEGAQQPAVA